MVATERDRAIADALAAQVTAANGSGKTWRKMTSLLDMWGHNRLTPAVKARMADALEQRFEVSPPLQELSRHNTVRLALRNSAYANGPASFHRSEHTGDSLPPEIVRVTHWRTAQAPVSAALRPLADNEDGFLWIDVNVSADPERLCELLDPVCGDEVDHGMVEDLLLADALPKVDEYTEDGRIRKVVAFGTRAVELDEQKESDTKAGALAFDLVEFLSNGRWLLTCSHKAKTFVGAREVREEAPNNCEQIYRAVAREWAEGRFATTGDLGLLVINHLATSYFYARLELGAWLESWELELYHADDDYTVERKTLIEIRGLIAEFRRRLNALQLAYRDRPNTGWFPNAVDRSLSERVDQHIEHSRQDLDELSEAVRGSFELLASNATARQLQLAEEQREATTKIRSKLEIFTSLFLVPTVVAGFFGANTYLPGGNGEHSMAGFEVMVTTMMLGSVLVYLVLRALRAQEERATAKKRAAA